MGRNAPCRGMYLELRRRPVSREHARPQPPAASLRYGGGAEEPAPVPVGVTGHRTQRPRGQVGPPGPRPAQPSSSLGPGGERRPIPPPLAPLIAQLVDNGVNRQEGARTRGKEQEAPAPAPAPAPTARSRSSSPQGGGFLVRALVLVGAPRGRTGPFFSSLAAGRGGHLGGAATKWGGRGGAAGHAAVPPAVRR
jgi:hypothetical protein